MDAIFRKLKLKCLEQSLDDILITDDEKYIIKSLLGLKPNHNNNFYRFVNSNGEIVLAIYKTIPYVLLASHIYREIFAKYQNTYQNNNLNYTMNKVDGLIIEILDKHLYFSGKIKRLKQLTPNGIWYVTERNAPF